MKAENIETDVLIIGGGAAGCSTALKAHKLGTKVLMVVKGKMGRSGATPLAAFLPGSPDIPGPYFLLTYLKKMYSSLSDVVRLPFPPKYAHDFRTMMEMHYWLADQDYFMDVALWTAKEFLPDIEKSGLYIQRDEKGKPITPSRHPYYTLYKPGITGYEFGEMRRKEVLAAGIDVMEESMAISLLRNRSGDVVGAMVLDYVEGKLYAVTAKSTVLATGHTNWLSKRATGTREMAANGLAMAANVGAELQNLEIQWFHASDTASPDSWMRMQHYPNQLPGTDHQAVMVNSEGDVYVRAEDYDTGVPYTIQMKKLYQQVKQGKARWDGGSYTDYRLVGREPLEKYQYNWEFYQKLGLKGDEEPLESAVTWHMSAGGVRANLDTMETNVSGLYIAGPVGGHMLGGIPLASYDGAIAGVEAVQRAQRMPMPTPNDEQIRSEEERIAHHMSREAGGGIPPIQVKNRIRETVWDRLMFVRSEQGLNQALDQLKAIQEEMVPNMGLRTYTTRYNTDLIDALDVTDMMEVVEMVIHAALARQESRGPHFREDFPVADNKNWMKYVVVSRDGEKVTTRLEPVRLKYMRPSRSGKVDYFADPYA